MPKNLLVISTGPLLTKQFVFLLIATKFSNSIKNSVNKNTLVTPGFVIRVSLRFTPVFCICFCNTPTQISFITYYYYRKIILVLWICHLKKLSFPVRQLVKSFFIGQVKHKYAGVCSSIEGKGYRVELLLASCVPNLKCHRLVGNLHVFFEEILSDSGLRT